MSLFRDQRGITLIEMSVVLLMIGVALGLTAPISRRIIARYELSSAAQTLSSDLAYAKIHAIKSNSITVLRRETEREYRVDDRPRQLPSMVRFGEASVDSLGFNGLGATIENGIKLLVLENHYGERVEVRVYSSGGYQVRRL
jgi:prepilin-type N-terminal cleavage/methylation domain-containing protein